MKVARFSVNAVMYVSVRRGKMQIDRYPRMGGAEHVTINWQAMRPLSGEVGGKICIPCNYLPYVHNPESAWEIVWNRLNFF